MPKATNRAVILTALPVECKAVCAHLTAPSQEVHGGTVYECGLFKSGDQTWEVAVAEIGAGNPNAAAEAQRAIDHFKPRVALFVGVAGGVKDVTLGDVVAATKIYDYGSGKAEAEFRPRPEIGQSSHPLEQRSRAEMRRGRWVRRIGKDLPTPPPRVFVGPIAAGEAVVASRQSDIYQLVRRHYSDALAVEMEGYGFLRAAHINPPVEALVIRGISDMISGKHRADAGGSQEIASRHASAFAFEVLARLGDSPGKETPDQGPARPAISAPEPPPRTEPEFPIFRVRDQNVNFTGREEILAALHDNLNTGRNTVLTQTITGLGGVGKTQIAVTYAHRYAGEYDLLWWVRAEEPAALTADYLELANRLNLPVKAKAEQTVIVNAVNYWLKNTPRRWLLIFDNAGQPDQLAGLLPTGRNGQVLITSRDPGWQGLGHVLPIAPFPPDEARQFLLRRAGTHSEDETAADRMAKLLGYLPLALEQAGALIAERGMSFDAYTRLYQEQRQELWKREKPPADYAATVTTTWELNFQQIRQSPTAAAMLNLCTFLAPDDIPLSIVLDGAAFLPGPLATAAASPLELDDAVTALYHYSLIGRQGDVLSIHRLVQDVAREQMGPERRSAWIEIAANLMNGVFPFDEYNLGTWSPSAHLLPHAIAVAEHAGRYGVAQLPAATLWQKTGEYLRRQGDFAQAQASVEYALTARRQILGEEDPATAQSLDYLGELYQEQAQFAQARACHEQALRIRQAKLGQEHADAADSFNNLGMLFGTQGDYVQARLCLEEALAIRKRILGNDHPDTATSLNNLGNLSGTKGNYAQAKLYFEEALAIRKRILGNNHPDTATSLNSLGGLFQAKGDYAQAKPHFEEALAIYRRVLGNDHPYTATGLNNVGMLFQAKGDYTQAKSYFEESLAIDKRVLGNDHPNTATSLNNVGMLFGAQGDYAQAKSYLEEALAVLRRVLGNDHPYTATGFNNLGMLLKTQGDYAQAKPYLEEALAIRRRVLGEDHPDTATSLSNLGALFQTQGDYVQAKPYFEEALAIYRRVLGDDHPYTATGLNCLGMLFRAQGDYVQARSYLEEALAIRRQVLGDDHPDTATTFGDLGTLFGSQGDYAQAKSYLEEALAIYRRGLGDDHPHTATCLNNLGALFEIQGDYAQAKPYFEEALAISRRVLGDGHPDTALNLNNLGALLFRQGRYVEARPYVEQALHIYEKVHGRSHPHLVTILGTLGSIMFKLKLFKQAREYVTRAVVICQETKEQEYEECQKVRQILRTLPGPIGHGGGKRKSKQQKHH